VKIFRVITAKIPVRLPKTVEHISKVKNFVIFAHNMCPLDTVRQWKCMLRCVSLTAHFEENQALSLFSVG
jgi:hypothetical protein